MPLACPNCGRELPDDARFCVQCGTQVAKPEEKAKPRFCDSCGVQLLADAKFCLECGTPVPAEARKPFYERTEADYEFEKEMFKYSPLFNKENPDKILDFESHQGAIRKRGRLWAEHEVSKMSAPEFFHWLYLGHLDGCKFLVSPSNDLHFYPTNKPNAHEALLQQTMDEWFVDEARRRGYIDWEGCFAPKVLNYYNQTYANGQWSEEELQETRCKLDFTKLEEKARKDDEMFPPPQPVRVEVAGAILNFTTDDAVIVVYVDCTYKGKKIALWGMTGTAFYVSRQDAEVIERPVGDVTICAAIFRPISFASDEIKNRCHYHGPPQQTKAKLQCSFDGRAVEEEIMLFKSNVTEIDWRGKK